MNGFTEKEIQNPSNIERIEVVLDELYVMKGISAFKNLKSLSLINVNLRKIEVFIIHKINYFILRI